jgi:hypothetical protein
MQKDMENLILTFWSLVFILKDVSCSALHMNGLTHRRLWGWKCEFFGFHTGAVENSGLPGCDTVSLSEWFVICLTNVRNHSPNIASSHPRIRDPQGSSYVFAFLTSFLHLPYSCTLSLCVLAKRIVASSLNTHSPRSNPGRSEIFRSRPDWSWGPPILLYNGYRVYFPGVKRPGRGVDHPPSSSAGVKERVELYLYSPSGPSWPVLWRTSPLPAYSYPEDGSSRFFQSLATYLPDYSASHPRLP